MSQNSRRGSGNIINCGIVLEGPVRAGVRAFNHSYGNGHPGSRQFNRSTFHSGSASSGGSTTIENHSEGNIVSGSQNNSSNFGIRNFAPGSNRQRQDDKDGIRVYPTTMPEDDGIRVVPVEADDLHRWGKLSHSEQETCATRRYQEYLEVEVNHFGGRGLNLHKATKQYREHQERRKSEQESRDARAASAATGIATASASEPGTETGEGAVTGADGRTRSGHAMTDATLRVVLTKEEEEMLRTIDLKRIFPPISQGRYIQLERTKDD
ncbi:hypothetical protein I302_100784 [Kwoniella bestiolae CBS 10118]|uniref:Uncharacterized protein n=1 Tax=Kwoniella bestiolae CBS 10118 TaxID=1296100 RepID=A0A1B9G653_9TREE|nr:hypothetical protein I302_04157 [Kwoniella bestiolae CBS 10118]OCF26472.1 hypothetical protein I302_04157 [Kwoniella bestiolae CBS 10118]